MKAVMEMSGSRHAMGKAHSYGHPACAMYDGKQQTAKC